VKIVPKERLPPRRHEEGIKSLKMTPRSVRIRVINIYRVPIDGLLIMTAASRSSGVEIAAPCRDANEGLKKGRAPKLPTDQEKVSKLYSGKNNTGG